MIDDIFEQEAERLRREADADDTPERRALAERKRQADFDKGVRLGWWNADGEPLAELDEEDEEDEDEEE